MDGTGYYWSRRRGGPILFAAAGRKAVARIGGRMLVFAPRRDARHLFPLTFDVWRRGDLTIHVTDTGVV